MGLFGLRGDCRRQWRRKRLRIPPGAEAYCSSGLRQSRERICSRPFSSEEYSGYTDMLASGHCVRPLPRSKLATAGQRCSCQPPWQFGFYPGKPVVKSCGTSNVTAEIGGGSRLPLLSSDFGTMTLEL